MTGEEILVALQIVEITKDYPTLQPIFTKYTLELAKEAKDIQEELDEAKEKAEAKPEHPIAPTPPVAPSHPIAKPPEPTPTPLNRI